MYNNPNGEELSQQEKIIVIMITSFKEVGYTNFWRASDFQKEWYGIFVGYEASARLSELSKKYPGAFEIRMNGRFREIRLKLEDPRKLYDNLPHDLGKHLVREGLI